MSDPNSNDLSIASKDRPDATEDVRRERPPDLLRDCWDGSTYEDDRDVPAQFEHERSVHL